MEEQASDTTWRADKERINELRIGSHLPRREEYREKNDAISGTICDALMAQSPGRITFEINRALVGAGVSASDEEVGRAVSFAFRELKLVVEPGGAVGLAALISGKVDVRGKIAVAVLSGGNVDPELFARLVA